MIKLDDKMDKCPKCKASWNGGDIAEALFKTGNYKTKELAEKAARNYGWTPKNKLQFKTYIGIEIQGEYDGISYFQCDKCEAYFDRFTGEEAIPFESKEEKEEDITEQNICKWCETPIDKDKEFCSEKCMINWVKD